MSTLPTGALEVLSLLEQRLDPASPERSRGLAVVAYGEVSACLRLDGLPGFVCKRMSGFADATAAAAYQDLVRDYLAQLTAAGVTVVETHIVPVPRDGRVPVVYLVQPEVDTASLGHRILVSGDDAAVVDALDRLLDVVLGLATSNRAREDGVEVALDGQLSNWAYADTGSPVLVDVGTPFMRRSGKHLIDVEWLHTPIPPVVRAYYRRRGLVSAYLDDYFDPRLVAVDLLGNFHKEGRPDRVPLGVEVVNRWLAGNPEALGTGTPVTAEEVEKYYRADADLLALYLRLRRGDRFVRTKVLRRPYDFVLPGPVNR